MAEPPFDSETLYRNIVKDQLICDFKDSIEIGAAVSIFDSRGSVDYWRIPLLVAGRVVGMMDVSAQGKVLRYGLYVTKRTDIATKSQDILELTPATIMTLANTVMPPKAVAVRDPRLLSLGAPTKIAWEVLARDPGSKTPVSIYVTPGYAWLGNVEAQDADGNVE
jgi:hypothetical protein